MRKQMLVLCLLFALSMVPGRLYAQELGPATSYGELLSLIENARHGDTVLVSGRIQADETLPLTTRENIEISSASGQKATLSGIHLLNADVSFSNVDLTDSLDIVGSSKVMLEENVHVSGDRGAAIRFRGNGELIITPSCSVMATDGANGVSIEHEGGSFYAALEGTVIGGDSDIGGAGVIVSPLYKEGMLLIGGSISGGKGSEIGGNAVNLYDIGGNAYISVTGLIQGGMGSVGGNGLQIISPCDTSNIGIIGRVSGGEGDSYGGNAVVVLNAEDRSSIALSGALIGGNTSSASSDPGQSLLLVGNGVLDHMYSNGCLLEDGQVLASVSPISEESVSDSPADGVSDADDGENKESETIDIWAEYEEVGMIELAANDGEPVQPSDVTPDVSQEKSNEDGPNLTDEQADQVRELADFALPPSPVEEPAAADSNGQQSETVPPAGQVGSVPDSTGSEVNQNASEGGHVPEPESGSTESERPAEQPDTVSSSEPTQTTEEVSAPSDEGRSEASGEEADVPAEISGTSVEETDSAPDASGEGNLPGGERPKEGETDSTEDGTQHKKKSDSSDRIRAIHASGEKTAPGKTSVFPDDSGQHLR